MCIYTYIEIILLILVLLEYISHKKSNLYFYTAAIIVLSLLAFRGKYVGGDTIEYANFFTGEGGIYGTINNPDKDIEIVFVIFCKILHAINGSPFFFIFITSLITLIPFLYLIYKNSELKTLPILLSMITWQILTNTQTAIRQNIAVSLFIIAFILITSSIKRQKKYILSFILLCLSISFHTSMLMIAPLLIIIYFIKLKKSVSLILLICSLFITLMVKDVFSNIFNSFYNTFNAINILNNMTRYYNPENSLYDLNGEVSFNRLAPLTLLVIMYVLLSHKSEYNSYYFKSLIIGCCIYNIGAIFPLISRTDYALLLIGIIHVPRSFKLQNVSILHIIIFTLLLFLLITQIKYFNNYDYNPYVNNSHILPYNFIF